VINGFITVYADCLMLACGYSEVRAGRTSPGRREVHIPVGKGQAGGHLLTRFVLLCSTEEEMFSCPVVSWSVCLSVC